MVMNRKKHVSFLPFSVGSKPLTLLVIVGGMLLLGHALIRKARHGTVDNNAYKIQLARDNMTTLRTALDILRQDCGRYPSAMDGLVSLIHDPGMKGWNGPYILKLKPDPWKRPFKYTSDTHSVILYSLGPDGLDGSPDDIRLSELRDSRPGATDTPFVPDQRSE